MPCHAVLSARLLGATLALAWGLALSAAPGAAETIHYPATRADSVVDDYFGTRMADPYRWLEDANSKETSDWVEAQNKVAFDYLQGLPQREPVRKRLTQLWNYAKVSVPVREGGMLFFRRNEGLQNQSPLYVQVSLRGRPRLLLDPNKLSPDGSLALQEWAVSPGGKYLCYALSQGGSDWEELHVRSVAAAKDLPDTLHWVKYSSIAWTRDQAGFFYSRYPAPQPGKELTEKAVGHQFYYHALGTSQSRDRLIYEPKERSNMSVGAAVTEDGRYLLMSIYEGTDPRNRLFLLDLKSPLHPDVGAPVVHLIDETDASYAPLGTVGRTLYVLTDLDASRKRIVAIDLGTPARNLWRTVVAERPDAIENATLAGGRLALHYLTDVKARVDLFGLNGRPMGALALPGIGSVDGLSARQDTPELFYNFTSPLLPTTVFRYDFRTRKSTSFQAPHTAFDPSGYETREVFYHSKDGTRVPMMITARKGLRLDGANPVRLYGYGGFDVSTTPGYSPANAVWLEMGGVYAEASIRGGSEYGEQWHLAAMKEEKQNVFDDFIAAAEYLIHEKYTSPAHLGIEGYSNGGLLVGACMTQRPELFAAAYPGAGVLDMLRYNKFSAGVFWVTEYGSAEDSAAFRYLHAYSPVHNVRPGTCYPATIITTADHDDRVVPAHSYKFAAALQAAQGCDRPVLLRVETKTSHGYMPTDKRILQSADILTFFGARLGATGLRQAAP